MSDVLLQKFSKRKTSTQNNYTMKNIYSLLIILLSTSYVLVAQNIYYTENFENGLPSGWELSGAWEVGDAEQLSTQYFDIPEHSHFLCFNDDAIGQGSGDDLGRIITPAFTLPNFSESIYMSISSYFENGDSGGADETAKISISTDDGASWTELLDIQEEIEEWVVLLSELDPSYSGQTVRFAFDYDDGGGWNYGWCIDDFEVREYFQRDVRFDFNNKESFFSRALVGAPIYGGGGVTNLGLAPITSLDLNITGNGTTFTETITGLNVEFNESAFVQMTTPFIMEEGTVDFIVSVSNINGMGDDGNMSDNSGAEYSVTSVTPHPDRGILVEESTSPGCAWCVRGAVYLEGMEQRYPGHFIGVAVQSGFPMEVEEYNQGMIDFGIFAQPSYVFNRQDIIDPMDVEQPFLDLITSAPVATLELEADYNDATRELSVSLEALFNENIPAGYRFNAVIMENNVMGSGGWYNQSNAYSEGKNGPMDIYTLLPSTIPSDIMVYNHVAREILAGWAGTTNNLESGASAGQTISTSFDTYVIPEDYDLDHIYIVGMLIADDGSIANAKLISSEKAGITSNKEIFNHNLFSVFPNPSTGTVNIRMNMEASSEVVLQVFNTTGQVVAQRNYGKLNGDLLLPFASDLEEGTYFFRIQLDHQVAVQRVMIVH